MVSGQPPLPSYLDRRHVDLIDSGRPRGELYVDEISFMIRAMTRLKNSAPSLAPVPREYPMLRSRLVSLQRARELRAPGYQSTGFLRVENRLFIDEPIWHPLCASLNESSVMTNQASTRPRPHHYRLRIRLNPTASMAPTHHISITKPAAGIRRLRASARTLLASRYRHSLS